MRVSIYFINHSDLCSAGTFHWPIILKVKINLRVPGFHRLAVSGRHSKKLLLLFLPKPTAHGSSGSSPAPQRNNRVVQKKASTELPLSPY